MSGDRQEFAEDKDRTKLVWIGIAVAVVLMLGAVWLSGRPDPNKTMVRAKHILIKCNPDDPVERKRALDTITKLRERIVAGEKFESLAREYSDDTGSKARGGDLGWEEPGNFKDDVIKNYALNAPIGELSEVLLSSYGFHLMIVEDRRFSEYDQRERDILEQIQREEQSQGTAPAAGTATTPAPAPSGV